MSGCLNDYSLYSMETKHRRLDKWQPGILRMYSLETATQAIFFKHLDVIKRKRVNKKPEIHTV